MTNTEPQQYVIPVTGERNDIVQSLIAYIKQKEKLPPDIFENIHVESPKCIYIPIRRYKGNYEGNWNCETAYTEQKLDITTKRSFLEAVGSSELVGPKKLVLQDVTRWQLQSGFCSGFFDVRKLATQQIEGLPEQLRNLIKKSCSDLNLDFAICTEIPTADDGNTKVLAADAYAMSPWTQADHEIVQDLAQREACRILQNQAYRNLSVSTRYDNHVVGDLYYVPFWYVQYSYKGELHSYCSDIMGEFQSASTPVDNEGAAFMENTETKKWGGTCLFCLLLIVAACIAPFCIPVTAVLGVIAVFVLIRTCAVLMRGEEHQKQNEKAINTGADRLVAQIRETGELPQNMEEKVSPTSNNSAHPSHQDVSDGTEKPLDQVQETGELPKNMESEVSSNTGTPSLHDDVSDVADKPCSQIRETGEMPQNIEEMVSSQSSHDDVSLPLHTQKQGRFHRHFVAGLLAVFLGGFGAHKFYNGSYGWGIIYLLISPLSFLLVGFLSIIFGYAEPPKGLMNFFAIMFFLWVLLIPIGWIEGLLYMLKKSSYNTRYNQTASGPFKW